MRRRTLLAALLPAPERGTHRVCGERPAWTSEGRVILEHPPAGGQCALYINGLRQAEGVDYHVTGNQVTFFREWNATVDLVVVDYWW